MSGYADDPTQQQFSDALTSHIQQTVGDMLSDWTALPDEFKSGIPQYLEINPPLLPISQIFGFLQTTASSSVVGASENRSSSTYGDLATVGPQLTQLPDGHYLVIWGCTSIGSPGVSLGEMAVALNATAAPAGDHGLTAYNANTSASVAVADTFLLTGGNSTLTAKYASSNNVFSANFAQRWMIALKYANA